MTKNFFNSYLYLGTFSYYTIGLLLGFFISNIIITIPNQTSDWGIVASSMFIACTEIINKVRYNRKHYNINFYCKVINSIKLGIIYGLFLDAFKLGS
uniref:hypothetical protein n=1 Tax=Rhodella violacea TaxID=2801 RepID=UPI001FCDE23E|nr:hypothetical protein MW504_pgp075 [Rhodella violacea]UNJ18101.1 hypothetical protein [Rhodella violacea]